MDNRCKQLLDKCQLAINKGNISSARLALNKVLRQFPSHPNTQLMLAKQLFAEGDIVDATHILTQLSQHAEYRVDDSFIVELINELKQKELYFPLKHLLTSGYNLGQLSGERLIELATATVQTGDVHSALTYLNELPQDTSNQASAILLQGHIFKALSDTDNAAQAYHQYIKHAPEMAGSGYWSLADLKSYQFSDDDDTAMKQCSVSHPYQKGLLTLAMHHSAAQKNHTDNAIALLVHAKQQLNCYRKLHRVGFDRLIKEILSEPINIPPIAEHIVDTDSHGIIPIFIVGLPRSGTTLTEQILAAHSQVATTDELPYIERIALYLSQKGYYPTGLDKLSIDEIKRLRAFYFTQVKQYPLDNAHYFIDKNPNNVLHIKLIYHLFPEAQILCLSRPVTDNAVSLYRQHFSKGNDYAYSPDDISHYISSFYTLLEYWKSHQNACVHIVDYQALVQSPEQSIRQLLTRCQLPFEEACLNFYQATSPVLTPSASQVRQPINTASLGSGHNYMRVFEQCETSLEALEVRRKELLS